MSIDHDDLTVDRTSEHLRFTWACVGPADCPDAENAYDVDPTLPCALAATHTNETGHETVVIRESRQVTTIARKVK